MDVGNIKPFPLNKEEMKDLMLDKDEEEITERLKREVDPNIACPKKRDERTIAILKTCTMINMKIKEACSLAGITHPTLYSWKSNYWKLSDAFLHHYEKWDANVEFLAKVWMMKLLMDWNPQIINNVLKAKDDRYNTDKVTFNDNRVQVVNEIDEEVKRFILNRASQWKEIIPPENSNNELPTLWHQNAEET